jgi:hypothetical protein
MAIISRRQLETKSILIFSFFLEEICAPHSTLVV